MSYIYYKNKFIYYPPFDIYNWRFIKSVSYHINNDKSNKVAGVIIKTHKTIFIPHLNIEDIHLLNKNYSKDAKIKQYYQATQFYPLFCQTCNGKGKMDWIEKIMKPSTTKYKEYQRDLYSNLIYPGLEKTIIFSRSILKEGEIYCQHCYGTGLELDARYIALKE